MVNVDCRPLLVSCRIPAICARTELFPRTARTKKRRHIEYAELIELQEQQQQHNQQQQRGQTLIRTHASGHWQHQCQQCETENVVQKGCFKVETGSDETL